MAKAKPTTATVTVTALVPVDYDGVLYAEGDQVEIRAEDLQQLLDVNAAVETNPAPAA